MPDDKRTFETDESGQVVRPVLHDGSVSGIEVGDGWAKLSVNDAEKHSYSLRLGGLDRLLANDFREGNIILDVVVRPCAADDGEFLARVAGLSSADDQAEFLADWLERSVAAGALVMEVNPSYGCSILALCAEVEIFSDDG